VRRVVAAVIVAAFVLGACGSSGKPPRQASDVLPDATTTTTTSPGASHDATPQPGDGSGTPNANPEPTPPNSSQPSVGGTTSTTAFTVPPSDGGEPKAEVSGKLPLHAEVLPKCVWRGDTVKVQVTTRPFASMASMAQYADKEAHDTTGIGSADRDGRWTWTFVVPPQAPPGWTRLYILGQDRTPVNEYEAKSNGDTAQGTFWMKVDESC